jgi:hypothetical protein
MRPIAFMLCVGALSPLLPALLRAEEPSVHEIIEKAITAHGGVERLSKTGATNFRGKGTFHGLGGTTKFTGEWWLQPPDKFRSVISLDVGQGKMETVRVLNGDKGWQAGSRTFKQMSSKQIEDIKEYLYVTRISHLIVLKDPQYRLTALGSARIGHVDALGIKVTGKNHKDISLFFDKSNGRLLMTRYRAWDELSEQEVEREMFYSNYKDQNGIKIPMKIITRQEGKDYVELTVTDYKLADKLDDKLFNKPSS